MINSCNGFWRRIQLQEEKQSARMNFAEKKLYRRQSEIDGKREKLPENLCVIVCKMSVCVYVWMFDITSLHRKCPQDKKKLDGLRRRTMRLM
jgi:hypothetical protein